MANDLQNLVPRLLARGLLALREMAVMPRLVNLDYSLEGAQRGSTIDVPVSNTFTANNVSPSITPSSAQDSTPGLVQIPLNQWKQVDFFLTDKQRLEIVENESFMPMNISEAVRALANSMDSHIHAQAVDVFGFIGTAGATPFSTIADVVNSRALLNKQLAPMNSRRIVMNPDAEANMLQIPAMSDLEKTGDQDVKIEGMLGRKFGFDMVQSQNVRTHIAGTAASITVASTTAAGATSLDIIASIAGTLRKGDIFSIAGNSQTYVVTSADDTYTSTKKAVAIQPPLVAIASSGADVAKRASHVVNLAFQREAFAFVNRPLANVGNGNQLGSIIQQMTDPVTGLTMRMEVTRQNKQEVMQLDVLYGAKTIRPQLAVRIAG
jgi:hypothetical protein